MLGEIEIRKSFCAWRTKKLAASEVERFLFSKSKKPKSSSPSCLVHAASPHPLPFPLGTSLRPHTLTQESNQPVVDVVTTVSVVTEGGILYGCQSE